MSRRKQKSEQQRRQEQPERPPAPPESPQDTPEKRITDWHWELIGSLVTGVPLLAIGALNQRIYDLGLAQPWTILVIAIPLAAIVAVSWSMFRRRKLTVHWVFWLLLGLYCTVFILLSTSDVLTWRREKVGAEAPLLGPPSILARLARWRYKLVPAAAPVGKPMVIVMLEPTGARKWLEVRYDKIRVMQLVAQADDVAGVAFDFYFSYPTVVDDELCNEIKAARKRDGFAVLSGFRTVVAPNGEERTWPPHDALEECLPRSKEQGHLMALRDAGNEIRELPVYVVADYPALSVRIAKALSKQEPALPADGRLRFVPPADVIREYSLEEVEKDRRLLSNKFVIVGERSNTDTYATPFGEMSGTRIQAYAARTLLARSYIVRPPGWASAALIVACCYVVTVFAGIGWSVRKLCLLGAVLTAGVIALSALAMLLFSVWLDIAYVIAAIWILIPFMLGLRRSISWLGPRIAAPQA
jgi:CHASE2 domain